MIFFTVLAIHSLLMSVEIYIDDLKPDIERQVLEELGLETAEDGNYDIIPLFSVERPE